VDKPHAQHSAAAFKGGVAKRGSVVDVQLEGQAAALNGGAQHVLAGAGVLVWHPATMDQHPTEVIHEQEQIGTFTARCTRVGHKWTDEHVANPSLIGPFGFEATERPWLASQCRTVQTTPV